ncbi:MAG: class I SAM-dependent methyltransferase family protein [Methanocellales archaeon]
MGLKAILQPELEKEELELLRDRFDLIGNIAVIHIPLELEHKKYLIARKLAEANRNVKTVLRKITSAETEFRVANYELLYGNSTETIHRENKCCFKLDPTKIHFTQKLAMERARIASLVKDGEYILCLFAGVGPFPIVIAREKVVEILAIEKNPTACAYFKKNLELNKLLGKIAIIEGDVEEILPRVDKKFDRIIMPSPYLKPEERFRYLDLALPLARESGVIHCYIFAARDEMADLERTLMKRFPVSVLRVKKCGSYAPGVHRVAVDLLKNKNNDN